jgi:hypothetical protein
VSGAVPASEAAPISADPRFAEAVAAIDAANAEDPVTLEVDGRPEPKELVHARMMTAWVRRLDPEATDLQLLAARAHHLRRWEMAREDYPEGRAGYLRWRAAQKKRHADDVGEILKRCGYDGDEIARVSRLIRKEGLGRDPQVQTHEDAVCLVFVQTQFADVRDQLGEDKMLGVVRKTLRKMSPGAIEATLALPLSDSARALIERAAAPAPEP